MKRIYYSGGSVITGDKVANSIIEYARELARQETSGSVGIPVVAADGSIHEAQLLLGPASELASVDEEGVQFAGGLGTTVESDAVDELTRLTAALRTRPTALDDVDLTAADPYDS